MTSTQNQRNFRSAYLFAGTLMVALVSTSSQAENLAPGKTIWLKGENELAGHFKYLVQDNVIPFTMQTSYTTSITGWVEDLLILDQDGHYDFAYRIGTNEPFSADYMQVTRTGFGATRFGLSGFLPAPTVDVDYDTFFPDLTYPVYALRSMDGSSIQTRYTNFELNTTEFGSTHYVFARTNASSYTTGATLTIQIEFPYNIWGTVTVPVLRPDAK